MNEEIRHYRRFASNSPGSVNPDKSFNPFNNSYYLKVMSLIARAIRDSVSDAFASFE